MTLATKTAGRSSSDAVAGGLREVLDLAYPVILTQLSRTTMGLVDSAMVGRLGAVQLASVGFGGIWLWTLFSLFFGAATGVQTFVSQAHGAERPRECGPWAWQGLYALFPAAAVSAVLVALALEPALWLLAPSETLQSEATSYILARLPGELLFVASMVVVSFFRGLGDTRTPLYITIGANLVNAVLDYGLIFGRLGLPEWGVAGAGIATSLATLFGITSLFAALQRRKLRAHFATRPVAPDRVAMWRFLRTGAPIGGQWFLDMMAFALFTTLVARMGDNQMAATQALLMLLSLSFMQAVGISVATSTLVGRYIGAQTLDAARRTFRSGLKLGAILSCTVGLIFVTFPRPLLRIFTDDPTVLDLGMPLIWLCAAFQFFDCAAIVSEGALRGAGDTRWPFLVQTALNWAFFLPLAYLLAVAMGYGLTGAWLAEFVYIAVLALVMISRFRSGAWEHIRI
ncbi:MAG TPA: MATE family efflux transporter [Myxococcota bacterium]